MTLLLRTVACGVLAAVDGDPCIRAGSAQATGAHQAAAKTVACPVLRAAFDSTLAASSDRIPPAKAGKPSEVGIVRVKFRLMLDR